MKYEKRFRIYTTISGGVTGSRSTYMKGDGEELVFESREEAQTFINECVNNHSPYRTFSQRYEIQQFLGPEGGE